MIQSVENFIRYFDGIHQRTLNFAQAIPPDKIDWSPQEDEFSYGDILRHLAAIEKITVSAGVDGQWESYPGHGRNLAGSLDEVVGYIETIHTEAMDRLRALPDEQLNQPRPSITGRPLKAWRLLMAVVEHEIHHRSQIASYLAFMGIEAPQIYGLEVDDVIVMSAKLAGGSSPEGA